MIILGSKDIIGRLSFETLSLANLVLILHKDNAFVYKDRFSTIGQRFVDFPEVAKLLEFHLSEIESSLSNTLI